MTLGTTAAISVAAVLAIFAFLVYFSLPVFSAEGARQVLSWDWRPLEGSFGILPMVVGSLALSTLAMVLAFPAAVLVCAFAYGVGPKWLARPVMAVINLMTGIPTIVYAFVAVLTIPPLLRELFDAGTGFALLGAAVTLAVLVMPTIVLVIDSNWRGLATRTGVVCAALGMSPAQHVFGVLVPVSRVGLLSAFVLGFGRALGDTMIALMLTGNAPLLPTSPLGSIRVLTAHIGMVLATAVGGPAHQSVFASGLILLLVTGTISVLVRRAARQEA
ncbi:MAG: ABC transporter permease subunit [Actinomycetota bacterium]|nr:ABC transporter permease subunit [Actinomycetota bacterium]